jgi:hypothetical protein
MNRRIAIFALAAHVGLAACGRGAPREADAAVRVDSARAVPQALARFREGLPEARELGGGYAADRDTLVRRFVAALERADTAAFMPMMLSRAEFAWLVYPDDPQSRPPYELPPELMWFQSMQQGEKGIGRALTRFGGRPLDFRGYACAKDEPRGSSHVWSGCTLDIALADGTRSRVRLFGGIVERGGRYKLVSYANEL